MFSKIIVTLILKAKLDVSVGSLWIICSDVSKKYLWSLLKINPEPIVNLEMGKIHEAIIILNGFKNTYSKTPDTLKGISLTSLWNIMNYHMEHGKRDEVSSIWQYFVESGFDDVFIWDLLYPIFVEDGRHQFLVDNSTNIFGDEVTRFTKLKMLAACGRLPAESYVIVERKIENASGNQKVLEVISDMVPEYAFY